jgi:hypothetical protein
MNEERELAAKEGKESPIWECIEDSHSCYNKNLKSLLENVSGHDCIFVASHNNESVNIAK